MTTRGLGTARRALLGSTALSVVEHSPHPVVLIGPRCGQERTAPIDPIITCLDGSAEAETIMPWVIAWSENTSASILLLRIVYPIGPPGATDPPGRWSYLEDLGYLANVKQQLQAEHPHTRHITMPHERPASAIREVAGGYDDAIFAVATSHPAAVKELLLGSTAADIIRTAGVPVLITSRSRPSPPR